MALTDNLVAYYKLDESSGNAADSINSYTLTNSNTTYGTGKINNGGQFNGSNAVLYRDGSGSLVGISYAQFATAWTISGWINPSVVNINQVPFSIQVQSGSSQRRNARLRLVSSALKMVVYDGTANEYDTGQTLSANTWYFVTLAYTGTNFEVYLNATRVLNQARSIGVASDSQGGGFGIGADRENSGTYEPWNGKVDEVGVWTRALASGDETSLYNGGAGLQHPFLAAYTKTLSEAIVITDSLIKTTGKILSETTTIVSSFIKTTSKIVSETISIVSSFVSSNQKSQILSETISVVGNLLNQAGKIFTETIAITDSIFLNIGKFFSETITLSDTISDTVSHSINKFFNETILLVDSVVVEKFFGRVLDESITLTDSFIRTINRLIVETISLTDSVGFNMPKILSESIILTDSIVKSIGRSLSETMSIVSSMFTSSILYRAFSEVVTVTDSFERVISKIFDETIVIADSFRKTISKIFSESLSIIDQSVNFFKRARGYILGRNNNTNIGVGTRKKAVEGRNKNTGTGIGTRLE